MAIRLVANKNIFKKVGRQVGKIIRVQFWQNPNCIIVSVQLCIYEKTTFWFFKICLQYHVNEHIKDRLESDSEGKMLVIVMKKNWFCTF